MFFSDACVELVKTGTVLQEEVYLEDDGDFKAILKSANKATYFTEEEWRTRKKRDDEDGGSGLFLDHETKLTHGFVSIQCESEAQVL